MTSNLELDVELSSTLRQLNSQIEVIFLRAEFEKTNPHDTLYADGKPILAPLLTAKADVLRAMVDLRRMAKE